MKLETGIAVGVGLVAALYLFASALGWGIPQSDTVPEWEQGYACGEFLVNTAFSDDFGILLVEGVGEPLLYVPGDTGAVYENSLFSFFFQGERLTIMNIETGVVLGECTAISDNENAPLNFGD